MDENKQNEYIVPGKTFAIGDIHGCYKALLQCIEESRIDNEKDTLIVLGDVVDGWPYVKETVDELLTFKNLITIRGNHDQWFMDYMNKGTADSMWVNQGGQATIDSYGGWDAFDTDKALEHMNSYFNKSICYYKDAKNQLFVHGGLEWHKPLEENTCEDFLWDRHAYQAATVWEQFGLIHPDKPQNWFKDYRFIFVGHTTTQMKSGCNTGTTEPVFAKNLINLDTGAGWSGKLTIMDVDSQEFWQSDLVETLYPEEKNARR